MVCEMLKFKQNSEEKKKRKKLDMFESHARREGETFFRGLRIEEQWDFFFSFIIIQRHLIKKYRSISRFTDAAVGGDL